MEANLKEQKQKEVTRISNQQFGELLVHEDSIIDFPEGIFGYEYLKKFALVEIEEMIPFIWLIAVDEPEIALPMLRYKAVYPNYQITLSGADRKTLQLNPDEEFHLFFVITVNEQEEKVTANLKGPIVIHIRKRLGAQIIATNEEYIIHYPVRFAE